MNTFLRSRMLLSACLLFVSSAPLTTSAAIDRDAQEQRPGEPGPERGFVEPRPGQGHYPYGGWYLGVYGHYSDTGLLLTHVYPRTPAARFGLEVGDCIVAVNGYQIGDVFNARLHLDVALQRHASRSGWVRLLVQDRRTLRLLNVDVQLIRGQVHL